MTARAKDKLLDWWRGAHATTEPAGQMRASH